MISLALLQVNFEFPEKFTEGLSFHAYQVAKVFKFYINISFFFCIIQMTNATELFRRNEKIAAIMGYSVSNARTNYAVVLIIQYPACLGASRVMKNQPRNQLRKVQRCIVDLAEHWQRF